MVGVTVWAALFSSAQVCFAPSIWRRLLMHAFCCAFKRARTKLGIAMVASNPMMATTIMISTSVKPAARECLFFIRLIFLPWREQGAGGLLIYSILLFTNCLSPATA